MCSKRFGVFGLRSVLVTLTVLVSLSSSTWALTSTARNWEEFMHYVLIGRWDLAQGYGQALIELDPDPVEVLDLAQSDRFPDAYKKLLLLSDNEQLRDIAASVLELIERGRYLRRTNLTRIADEIDRLSGPTRGRMLAVSRLADSGEWAVPLIIQTLRDPTRSEEYANIIWALPKLNKEIVGPLLVVLQQCDELNIQLIVLETLEQLGYPQALPYLLEILERPDASAEIREKATEVYERIAKQKLTDGVSAALEFEQLAEGFYNHQPSLQVAASQIQATVWFWDRKKGLVFEQVPAGAFDELMTMRACEQAIRLDGDMSSAIALWLSAFFRLEAEGYDQPKYFGANHAGAATYAMVSGPEYLHQVLNRALQNRNQAVALAAINVLQRNSGQQSLLYEIGGESPILQALSYPDREVRYRAALTVAGALPTQPFDQSDLVLPILAEMMRQKGQRYAMVVDADQERRNQMIDMLQSSGDFAGVGGEAFFAAAMERSRSFPSIDLLLVAWDIDKPTVAEGIKLQQTDQRLGFCPTIVYCPTDEMPAVTPLPQKFNFVAVHPDTLAIDQIRSLREDILARNHAVPFDQSKADAFAAQAAQIMRELAVSGNTVLDLRDVQDELIEALNETRRHILVDAIYTLSCMDTLKAQRALAEVGLSPQRPRELQLLSLQNLARSAKFFGNLLVAEQIEALEALATDRGGDDELRSIAAETFGSLNLPSRKINHFIVDQIVTEIE